MDASRRLIRLRRCSTRTGWSGADGASRFARLSRNSVALGSNSHALFQKRKAPFGAFDFLAERAGFEPAVRYKRTLAFQASALSHSATSPNFCHPGFH